GEPPPLPVGGLHDPALVQRHGTQNVGTRLVHGEPGGAGGHRRALADGVLPPAALGAEGLAGADHHRLPRAVEPVGTRGLHPPGGRVVGADDEVAAVDLVEVVTLTHAVAGGNDGARTAFDHAGQVGLQFDQL